MAPPPIPRGSSLTSHNPTDTLILTALAQCPGVPSGLGQNPPAHLPETPGSPVSVRRPAAQVWMGVAPRSPAGGQRAALHRRRPRRSPPLPPPRPRLGLQGGFVYHLSEGEGEEQTGSVRAGRDAHYPPNRAGYLLASPRVRAAPRAPLHDLYLAWWTHGRPQTRWERSGGSPGGQLGPGRG